MDIIPSAKASRFEQLEPGDLFIYFSQDGSHYALKTEKPSNGDKHNLVLLGPTFPQHISEAYLLPWQPATVLSFGKNYSVLLPTDPNAWAQNGPNRDPVCLALSGDTFYLCVNCGKSPQHFFQCFVELKTGAIVEGRFPSASVFTNTWEIAVLNSEYPPRTLLKYPFKEKTT